MKEIVRDRDLLDCHKDDDADCEGFGCDLQTRYDAACQEGERTEMSLKKARENQEKVRKAKIEIGQVYHP